MGLFRRRREPFLTASPDAPVPGMIGAHEAAVPAVPAPSDVTLTSTASTADLTSVPFSFTVEDVFSITGRGTVATGTVAEGTAHRGDAIEVVRGGTVVARTAIDGIEQFRRRTDTATAGDAAGILLRGVRRDELERGDVLRRAG
ncbi:hypothetical protein GCM10025864_16240 [Luteimicrobium album]|uniref:Translation elongation factor EFTu-like domain-containing protein n=1 Tax=Luteimicrobium album TaxID=1054550 RepID=A0ABQ6I229_9MICO|nr:EF-Tu/IF-2/RF-3 family GTPase [Luteimicrobium album]GMA23865.1 hypothetical protein GCM10025864_16240 [Luteimicrobium album]